MISITLQPAPASAEIHEGLNLHAYWALGMAFKTNSKTNKLREFASV